MPDGVPLGGIGVGVATGPGPGAGVALGAGVGPPPAGSPPLGAFGESLPQDTTKREHDKITTRVSIRIMEAPPVTVSLTWATVIKLELVTRAARPKGRPHAADGSRGAGR